VARTDPGAAEAGWIVVVADDLIWADRLVRLVRAAGVLAVTTRSLPGLRAALPTARAVLVDLTAQQYDPLAAVAEAGAAGCRVLAVAQHDDLDLHRRARAAGAERVVAYRLLHERGAEVVRAWLAEGASASADEGSAVDEGSAAGAPPVSDAAPHR